MIRNAPTLSMTFPLYKVEAEEVVPLKVANVAAFFVIEHM